MPRNEATKEQRMPNPVQFEYDEIEQQVKDLAAMTAYPPWGRLWEFIGNQIEEHTRAIFNPECKTSEVMEHRETVLAYERLKDHVRVPLRALAEVKGRARREEPLFPLAHPITAKLDEATGLIIVAREEPQLDEKKGP